jgi:hypothetical protein
VNNTPQKLKNLKITLSGSALVKTCHFFVSCNYKKNNLENLFTII